VGGRLGRDLDGAVFLAQELLGVLALGIAAAREELAVASPLDDHGRVALLALEVGRDLLALQVAHVHDRLLEVDLERRVEIAEQLDPVALPSIDAVKVTSRMSGNDSTNRSLTLVPSVVGWKRPSRFST